MNALLSSEDGPGVFISTLTTDNNESSFGTCFLHEFSRGTYPIASMAYYIGERGDGRKTVARRFGME